MTYIEKLTSVSGMATCRSAAVPERLSARFGEKSASELIKILRLKNGFYAFEGALHVQPDSESGGLTWWNDESLWRAQYAGMADGVVFFAEDAFGGQFCLRDGAIFAFDPETGELEELADSMESWAKLVLSDYPALTGHPVARAWQQLNGRLRDGARLVPKIPFVLGGAFEAANLVALDAVEGMRYRASVAVQIRDLPDGAQVQLRVIE